MTSRTFTHRVLPFLIATAVVILPTLVSAATYNGLVVCDGVKVAGSTREKCDFVQLIKQIEFLINWMFYIAIPMALCLFTWAGFLYMSTESGKKSQARSIFTNALVGFIIMLTAWFLVHTIVTLLVAPGSGYEVLLGK